MTDSRLADFVRGRFWFAFTLAAAIWTAWIAAVAVGGGTFDAFGNLVSGDHLAFYTPARLIRESRAEKLYDYPYTATYQNEILDGRYHTINAFRNPPFYALLYLPTAGLPYPVSAVIWDVVSLLSLVVGVRLLGVSHPWRVTAFALTFAPVFHAVSYGQNSLLSFAVFAACYRLLVNDRRFLAGLVAGLLCFKPTLLIGLVVWGLLDIRRLWPAALGVVVTGVVLVGGSYAIVPEAWEAYLANFREIAAYNAFDQWKVHTPRAFWAMLLPDWPDAVTPLTFLSTLLGIGVFYKVWRSCTLPPCGGGLGWGVKTSPLKRPPPQPSPIPGGGGKSPLPLLFGSAVALTLWASPHALIYEWALAVVPAALWWEADPKHRDGWLVIFAVMWVAFLTGTDAARFCDWSQRDRLGWDRVYLFQYTVPVAAWAGWKAARLLTDSAGSPVVHPAKPGESAP